MSRICVRGEGERGVVVEELVRGCCSCRMRDLVVFPEPAGDRLPPGELDRYLRDSGGILVYRWMDKHWKGIGGGRDKRKGIGGGR